MISLGLPAQGDPGFIAQASIRAESLGFERLWLNDTPMADGIADALIALGSTSRLSVGLGVVAVDRRPVDSIIVALGPRGAEGDQRLVLGLGAGFSSQPLKDVRHGVEQIRKTSPDLTVAVAAMGPKMCVLAGEVADIVLLNWMTPERIIWARERIDAGASARLDGVVPKVAAYVRVAVGDSAGDLIAQEAGRYAGLPHYARHFEAMGVVSPGVVIHEDGGARDLAAYREVCDEVVARSLADSRDGLMVVAEAVTRGA